MKQFLNIFFLAVIAASCSDSSTVGKESKSTVKQETGSDETSNSIQPGIDDVDVDTIGMAEFLALKAAQAAQDRQSNGIQSNGIQSDDISYINDVNVDTIGFAAFKRLKAETARQAYEDSISRAEIIAERKRNNASRSSSTSIPERSTKPRKPTYETPPQDQTEVAQQAPEVKEKKGWSKKAKGAVIGAASGAAAGAIINKKNRGVGGVVGGVVGAAAGYGIGRNRDKKDEKKELVKDSINEQQ